MNRKKSHQKRVAKAVRKAALKNKTRDLDQLRKVKIQTAPLWKRAIIAAIGIALLYVAITFDEAPYFLNWIIGLLSLIPITIAIRGRKDTIDQAMDKLDSALTENILEEVIGSLLD